jgi:hypothetical protein
MKFNSHSSGKKILPTYHKASKLLNINSIDLRDKETPSKFKNKPTGPGINAIISLCSYSASQ